MPPARQAELRALYDEEVAYTDLHIGRLLDFLTEAGLWDSTCVIFVADHGEKFLDHGSAGHAETLFQELIHVTLLIADPSRPAPAVVNRRVETRWLFPTILNIVRADPPSGSASSSDLFAPCENGEYWVRSSTRPQPLSTLREGSVAGIWLSCLVSDRYKLIRDHAAQKVLLFDLVRDPRETTDISAAQPDLARRLACHLREVDGELGAAPVAPKRPRLDREQVRRLRDLGYL